MKKLHALAILFTSLAVARIVAGELKTAARDTMPLRRYPIAFTVPPAMLNYANQILDSTDQVHIPQQWLSLAPMIIKAKRMLMTPSLAEAKNWPDSIFKNFEIFAYDFEHWPYTPADEQANPIATSMKARDFAHQHRLQYTLGPDRLYASTVGPAMAVYADAFVMQMQRLQHNPSVFTDTLRAVAARIRAQNPNIKIWVQIGAQVAGEVRSTREMLVAADSARPYMDGLVIFYGAAADTLKRFIELIRGTTTGWHEPVIDLQPRSFQLKQNYPNPFNPHTVISFQLSINSYVTLKVFDVNGREVATLVEGEMEAGSHAVTFAPRNLPGSLYFYTLTAGEFSQTRKAVLLR